MRAPIRVLVVATAALLLASPLLAQDPASSTVAPAATDGEPAAGSPAEPTATTAPDSAPAAAPAVSVSVSMDYEVIHTRTNQATAMVVVRGDDTATTQRVPVSLAVVIDASGSMEGEKIEHARDAARTLLARLSDGDVVSIISYDTSATTHLANFVIGDDPARAFSAISGIAARGNTCVSCGIEAGYAALASAPESHVRRLVLLSDGRANRGLTDATRLGELAAEALDARRVPTATIGVGNDYDEDIMTRIATGGGGAYYFMPNTAALTSILDRELVALESTVATNVAVVLTAMGGAELGETEAVGARRDGSDVVVTIGPLARGEQRRVLIRLRLPEGELGQILSATAVFTAAGVTSSETVAGTLARSDVQSEVDASANTDVIELQNRLDSAADISAALTRAASGDSAGARAQLEARARELESAAAATGSAVLLEEAGANRALADSLGGGGGAAAEPAAIESLQMQNRARRNEVQRGLDSDEMYHQNVLVE